MVTSKKAHRKGGLGWVLSSMAFTDVIISLRMPAVPITRAEKLRWAKHSTAIMPTFKGSTPYHFPESRLHLQLHINGRYRSSRTTTGIVGLFLLRFFLHLLYCFLFLFRYRFALRRRDRISNGLLVPWHTAHRSAFDVGCYCLVCAVIPLHIPTKRPRTNRQRC